MASGSQSGLPWQRGISVTHHHVWLLVISTVCQWKLITRLNALHPWANYQLSGSCYIDHDNPPAKKEGARGRWVYFQGVLKFLTTIHEILLIKWVLVEISSWHWQTEIAGCWHIEEFMLVCETEETGPGWCVTSFLELSVPSVLTILRRMNDGC